MSEYIWRMEDWPKFTWNRELVMAKYLELSKLKAVSSHAFSSLSLEVQKIVIAETIAEDAVASSALEGISISYASVYSAISKILGLDASSQTKVDLNSRALAEILYEATNISTADFSKDKMLTWHRRLFEGLGGKDTPKLIGAFRNSPVYVMKYTGRLEGEILYEGLPSERINEEMDAFITFLKDENIPSVLRSAVSALWFPLIHPFQDGNGRISRIIADMVLLEGEENRYISVSAAIRKNKKNYYALLEKMDTKTDLDITEWILWYMDMLIDALETAEKTFSEKLRLSRFMSMLDPSIYNSREINMLYRLASGAFYGHLTAEKWKKMTKCTASTATRDLSHLVEEGLLLKEGEGGRGIWYRLNPDYEI